MKSRMIYDEVWRDDDFFALSDQAKLLYFYLHTNTRLQLIRAYKLPDREICNDLGMNGDRLTQLKQELEPLGIIFLDGYVILGSKYAVFRFKGPKLEAAITRQEKLLPNSVYSRYMLIEIIN